MGLVAFEPNEGICSPGRLKFVRFKLDMSGIFCAKLPKSVGTCGRPGIVGSIGAWVGI